MKDQRNKSKLKIAILFLHLSAAIVDERRCKGGCEQKYFYQHNKTEPKAPFCFYEHLV
jgi:hypothetical protein